MTNETEPVIITGSQAQTIKHIAAHRNMTIAEAVKRAVILFVNDPDYLPRDLLHELHKSGGWHE